MRRIPYLLLGGMVALLACARTQPDVVIVTATFPPPVVPDEQTIGATTAPTEVFVPPSPDPPRDPIANTTARDYVVQPGDTLGGIAAANGLTLPELTSINTLDNPNVLSVGQVLRLPAAPTDETPAVKLMSDVRFVRALSGSQFNVEGYVNRVPGYLSQATDRVDENQANGFRTQTLLTGAQVVERVSLEYSVDPRLLLALLEYRSGWLSNPEPDEEALLYPMGQVDENREGLYKQLAWAANRLNAGYYGWRYRDERILAFEDGERLLYHPELNAGTVGIQYFLSLNNTYANWLRQVGEGGFGAFYRAMFDNPFTEDNAPLVPEGLQQPELALPFASDEVWFYTGGPHGGWGSGSAWSAVDFAPPDDITGVSSACYTSEFAVRAVAAGDIVRSGGGTVILDLDGDSNEATGWTILYLHVAAQGRVTQGTQVAVGDVIGYASCEGGFSTATHVHIGRRYNGEWIPAYCHDCPTDDYVNPFVMGGWTVIGFNDQEYQGIMIRGGERRQAEQGRQNPINRISW